MSPLPRSKRNHRHWGSFQVSRVFSMASNQTARGTCRSGRIEMLASRPLPILLRTSPVRYLRDPTFETVLALAGEFLFRQRFDIGICIHPARDLEEAPPNELCSTASATSLVDPIDQTQVFDPESLHRASRHPTYRITGVQVSWHRSSRPSGTLGRQVVLFPSDRPKPGPCLNPRFQLVHTR